MFTINPPPENQQDRINLRLKRSVNTVLERAASFEGETDGNFKLTSALAQTQKEHS